MFRPSRGDPEARSRSSAVGLQNAKRSANDRCSQRPLCIAILIFCVLCATFQVWMAFTWGHDAVQVIFTQCISAPFTRTPPFHFPPRIPLLTSLSSQHVRSFLHHPAASPSSPCSRDRFPRLLPQHESQPESRLASSHRSRHQDAEEEVLRLKEELVAIQSRINSSVVRASRKISESGT